VKTKILLALAENPWELELMSAINENQELQIRRRCIDSVDLLAGIHLGLANKVIISSDFKNLNFETIKSALRLGCEVIGVYLQDDLNSANNLKSLGINNCLAITPGQVGKILKVLLQKLPFDKELETFSQEISELDMIPGLISIYGTNGSPGRTSSAINLAFSLANKNSPTLLIDLDAVAPSISSALGIVSEIPGISSLVHEALKGRLSANSFSEFGFEVKPGLHVITGITNPNRWPELRTSGLLQVLDFASKYYANIICDLSAILPETTDEALSDLDIFKRFDHIPAVINKSTHLIYLTCANPLSLLRASESLEMLNEISSATPKIILNKINEYSLGEKYGSVVEAILGRWTDLEEIIRIPENSEAYAQSWMSGGPVLLDKEIRKIFESLAHKLAREITFPPKFKQVLRKVS